MRQVVGREDLDPRFPLAPGIKRADPERPARFGDERNPLRRGAGEGLAAEVERSVAELFLDAEEAVVLGDAL